MADRWDALGQAIHIRRRELGIRSQAAAAELAGIALNTWNRAECGRPVGDDTLRAIATALQWDPGVPLTILRGTDPVMVGAIRATGTGGPGTPPLAVIPLATGLEIAAAILGALADAWETQHGQVLTTGNTTTEPTAWGPCMVVRAPGQRTEVDRAE